jgi:hypothetical protein
MANGAASVIVNAFLMRSLRGSHIFSSLLRPHQDEARHPGSQSGPDNVQILLQRGL